ncbi:MAG: hypothetical protein K6F93_03030 [Lachnospiraceae bacterium]|nr:hypothetical protein [Lachnospiraceae bacterium]
MKKYNFVKGLLTSLMAFALCLAAFGVAAKADETPAKSTKIDATYDATNDTVRAGSNAYVYVVKAATGNKLKAGTAANGQLANGKISIADLGIKSTKKDVFLYVCNKEVEVEETVAANLTIKGNSIKVVGTIDYTQADVANSVNVISAYYKDKKTKKNVDIEDARLYWSADQEKWYLANGATTAGGRKVNNVEVADGFRGADLKAMLEAGGTIYIKQAGVSGASGTAEFGSVAAKVKVAKQAKAPKTKYDYKKDTLAIKNGYDFALAQKSGSTYTVAEGAWFTIAPFDKNAKTKTAADSIVATTNFAPVDKKDDNAFKLASENGNELSYTSYKFKNITLDDIIAKIGAGANGDFSLAVRKSATYKKSASAVTYIDFEDQTAAPLVLTSSKVLGQFDVVTSTEDFNKKGLVIGEGNVVNFTDTTTGYDDSFKLITTGDGVTVDANPASYEFTVVKTADYTTIDWTSVKWKKLDAAKTKFTGKLKFKYDTSAKKKNEVTLKAMSVEDNFTAAAGSVDDAETEILVRRAGVKGDTPVRPSGVLKLYVAKNGKKYTLYTSDDVGAAATKYTVSFYTLQKNAQDAYGWTEDESIAAVTGWGDAGQTESVTFPTIDGAVFYLYNGSAVGEKLTPTEGKYTVTVAASVKVAVDKPVKVTYDLNKSEGLTTSAVAPAVAITDKGVITPSTASLTGTMNEVACEVKGWYLDKACTKAVSNATIFVEDTTIYAKWGAQD